MQTIPMQANLPAQAFSIVLNDVAYNLTLQWNTRAEFWTLDIADENGATVLSNVALKTGGDLLDPFNLNMGKLYVVDLTADGQEASLSNIGTTTLLVYLTPDE